MKVHTQARVTRVNASEAHNLSDANLPSGINIVRESEYGEHMATSNKQWRNQHVVQGEFAAYDGLPIRYYHASQQGDAKGCIVMLHGYCGFWGKFHEMAEYYWLAGYEVFFMEHRGHGYSGRQIDEADIVHVNSYNDYTQDIHQFMTEVVNPRIGNLTCIMFAHSMGGAIGALYLEQHPGVFDAAILSSPMFGIKTDGTPKFLISLMLAKIKLLRQEKQPFPGGKHWDGIPTYEQSSAMSEARYTYIFNQRLADSHYHTNMMSNGWGYASFRTTPKILRDAGKIDIPVLLLTSGNDALVDSKGHYKFAYSTPNTEFVIYEGAKHELYNGTDEILEDYYRRIFGFLGKVFGQNL